MGGTVYALAADGADHVCAGGRLECIGGVTAKNIATWNGGRWSAMGSGAGGDVYALAIDQTGELVVGGTS